MTVLEAIQLTTDFFAKKGIESPRLNAELLLCDILLCKRLDLYMKFDQPLKEHEVIKYREYLKRRGQFEPLQYILGNTEFYGYNFKVNQNALIPRQETEILVETIINTFPKDNHLKFLDIGTGTGNIPITLAKEFINAGFCTIDINQGAIELAKENALINNVDDRIEFMNTDILNLDSSGFTKFDVIVSNPPYVSVDEYKSLQPEITVYEPGNAVTDYSDGLRFYKEICTRAKDLLCIGGYIFFEMGKGQFGKVSEIMTSNNFKDIVIKKDYLNIERVIYGVLS